MSKGRNKDAGLTLIEMLVSLAIFAVIGVAGLAVLNTIARTGERTDGRLERLAEVDRAFLVIRRDLAQITPANTMLDAGVLSFRRMADGAGIDVSFVLENTTLLRRIQMPAGPEVEQQILSGVASMEWKLLDGSKRWHNGWPPPSANLPGAPQAIELKLDIWRIEGARPEQVTRLFALPAGAKR